MKDSLNPDSPSQICLHRLLVATDFSPLSAQAMLRAVQLAQANNVESICLLHVLEQGLLERFSNLLHDSGKDLDQLQQAALGQLQKQALEIERVCGVPTQCEVRSGIVEQQINLAAAQHQANLILLGAHSKPLLHDLFLGSTVERVIQRSGRHVLVVRSAGGQPYRKILVPVDFSADSRRALAQAAALGGDPRVSILHVYDVPFAGRMEVLGVAADLMARLKLLAQNEAEQKLLQFLADLQPSPRFESHLEQGDPAEQILALVTRERPNLLVLGKRGHSALQDWLLGSVTLHVTALAACDILAVGQSGCDRDSQQV